MAVAAVRRVLTEPEPTEHLPRAELLMLAMVALVDLSALRGAIRAEPAARATRAATVRNGQTSMGPCGAAALAAALEA